MIRPVLSSIAGSSHRSHLAKTALRFGVVLAVVAALSAGLVAIARAEHNTVSAPAAIQQNGNSAQEKQKSVVETGCLIRRDKPGDFALTTRDAKLFYVESSTVDLSAHVGHTVTVTGTFAPDSETRNDPDKAPEAQTIKVTKLEMISKTCH